MDDGQGEGGQGRRWSTAAGDVAALTSPGLGFLVPGLGPWLSMLAVVLAVRHTRPRLGRSRWRAPAAVVALWWPSLLAVFFFDAVAERLSRPGASEGLERLASVVDTLGVGFWLFVPLAAPEDVVTPGLAPCAVLALGAAGSVHLRRPWPWLLAAVAAPLTYAAVLQALDPRFLP